MIAWRYLRPRRGEGFMFIVAAISVLGIMLGVAALVSVMTFMNGFRADLLDKIIGVNGHALILGYDGKLNQWPQLLQEVRATTGVVRAIPLIERQVMGSHQQRSSGVIVRALPPAELHNNSLFARSIVAGNLKDFVADAQNVVIGSGLAEQLSLRVGDAITLISPDGDVTPFGTTPRISAFHIVAIVQVGVQDYDKAFVFMPIAAAQSFFGLGDAVGGIDIISTNPDTIEQTIAPLRAKIPLYGQVYTWKIVNKALFDALQVEQLLTFFIVSIIMLVAAFNIISSLIMLVQSKTRDIAILRTMGAERLAIMRLFMLAGTMIGALGIALGFGLGALIITFRGAIVGGLSRLMGVNVFNPDIYFLYELPARVDWMQLTYVLLLSFVLTLLATLYPSWKAASTDPVKVLRYE